MPFGGKYANGIYKQSKENMPLITVITVVRNGEKALEETILSVINQTYANIEYIIIDGASTDGTLDIVKKYEDKIDCWISEPDKGLYDAMNKGIDRATGDWINFMNCGDYFPDINTVRNIFEKQSYGTVDIIYGNSIEKRKERFIEKKIKRDIKSLNYGVVYRHGASFVKAEIHRLYKFDMSKSDVLGFSLDYECMFRLYKGGKVFQYVDLFFCVYEEDGVSHDFWRCIKYNYLISSQNGFNLIKWIRFKLYQIAYLLRLYDIRRFVQSLFIG